jgi:hypothetical protein
MINTIESTFDGLVALECLSNFSENVTLSEVQFFAYFACLVSLYDGGTISDWGYKFVNTSYGTPYSENLNESWKNLQSNHSIIAVNNDGGFKLTTIGAIKLKLYRNMSEFRSRLKYLETVKSVFSVLPEGVIKEALHNEPSLRSALMHKSASLLLDESSPASKALYVYFGMLKIAMDKIQPTSLAVPATVWVEALQSKNYI